MSSLYELTPELEKKYKKSLDLWKDTHFTRYYKRYFKLLSSGNYEDYAPLFTAFELGVEHRMFEELKYNPETTLTLEHHRTGTSVAISKDLYHMYLNFLENVILPEVQEPEENTKLMITTHNGGTHIAYYRNKQYEVPMSDGSIRIEDAVVIYWRPYDEKYNPFTGTGE